MEGSFTQCHQTGRASPRHCGVLTSKCCSLWTNYRHSVLRLDTLVLHGAAARPLFKQSKPVLPLHASQLQLAQHLPYGTLRGASGISRRDSIQPPYGISTERSYERGVGVPAATTGVNGRSSSCRRVRRIGQTKQAVRCRLTRCSTRSALRSSLRSSFISRPTIDALHQELREQ